MIRPYSDIGAGMPFGAALAHNDIAASHGFAAEFLDAKPPARGIAAVPGRTACFFMCHRSGSISLRESCAARASSHQKIFGLSRSGNACFVQPGLAVPAEGVAPPARSPVLR